MIILMYINEEKKLIQPVFNGLVKTENFQNS